MDKRYNHTESEQQALELWSREDTYARKNNPGQLYSIDTPPPTVSGNLHIGHLFSYTQTDILARYHRMSGFSVFYPFGFDDNGLPTEKYVEKVRNVKAHEVGRSAFIKLCLEQTELVEHQFKQLWQRMGLSVDWNSCYSTISKPVRKLSQESFILLYEAGYIYRKNEPALYCTSCRTSVAQAELEDSEQPSFFNDIVFKDSEGNQLIIGTTRPELLYSCVALLYHPTDSRYQHLKNKAATVPLFGHDVPLIADELVDKEKGTGLVMCCTFGDKTDIQWYKMHKLPYRQSIGLDGKFVEETGILAGLKVPQARKRIVEELQKQNLLKQQKPITHVVNVHERCQKPIEIVMIPQWFLKILDYKKTFLELAEQVDWFPAYMKSRYLNWVENISWDWCLSRQRFYGIPFPVWHCTNCNKILLAPLDDLPIDPQEHAYPGKGCPECKSTDIVADTDVMDTWNTSSLTPYICYNLLRPDNSVFAEASSDKQADNKVFIPMSMRPQAHDIIRTWAFYTIVKAWMHNKVLPWKSIVISGHVLSDKKEKLSKSKANDPLSPDNLLKRYPADAIRYWTASGGLGHDVSFSENQLKIGGRLLTKLWNAFRFAAPYLEKVNPEQPPTELNLVNKWILTRATDCFLAYQKQLNDNEFSAALDHVEQFFWKNFCDNYLELIKGQLLNSEEYSPEVVTATCWTLYYVGLRILQLYAPYLPFITEALYQQLYHKTVKVRSLHQTRFAEIQSLLKSKEFYCRESVAQMEQILHIISQVRKLKTEQQLSLRTELAELTIGAQSDKQTEQLEQQKQLLQDITHAHKLVFTQDKNIMTQLTEKDGNWHASVLAK